MASFGLKYYAQLSSRYMKTLWRVEIAQRNYSGTAEEMTFSGSSPIKVTWEKRGDDFYTPIKASEATITILCKDNFHYLGLFTSDPRYYRMSIFRNGELYWRGFITADLYSEKFTAPPYEVSIKAVDGFNLLSSIDFRDLMGIGISGRKSLRQLLVTCIDLLELDMPLVDWLDLYGENMNENVSPLSQTYIDIERLFFVYEEPSYRDILELCIAPFAAQIFQSGGSLHLRRLVTLYEQYRPANYYNVANFGKRKRDTDNGLRLAGTSLRMVTVPCQRDINEYMWKDGLYILGDSTNLDIVPALKTIAINVTNKSLGDLATKVGFLDPDGWNDPNNALTISLGESLKITGNSTYYGTVIQTNGIHVEQCGFLFTWEFMLKAAYTNWVSSGGGSSGHSSDPTEHTVTIKFGVKVVGSGETYWLGIDGSWNDEETIIEKGVKGGSSENMKIEFEGFPCNGTLYFFINQTLLGSSYSSGGGRTYSYSYEYMNFLDMHLDVDAGELYELGLALKSLVNPANNIDMEISLPVSDIPAIPNDVLLYALYYLNGSGSPTRLWHTMGKDDYGTLLDHMALCARRLQQMPSKRLTGDLFTSLHIDLNSVIVDDKFLDAAYAVNSVELQAVDDSCNCELIELPKFINADVPLEGDNCIQVARFHVQIEACVRCMDFIIVKTITNEILRFDTISRNLEFLYSSQTPFVIFPAEDGFVRIDNNTTAYYCDYRGIVRNIVPVPSTYGGFMTYFDGAFCMFYHTTGSSGTGYSRVFSGLMTPSSSTVPPTVTHVAGVTSQNHGDQMFGTFRSAVVAKNQIIINTDEGAFLHDRRYHNRNVVNKVGEDYCDIKAIDDNYWVECRATTDMAHLCKRTSILTATDVHTIGRYSQKAAVSMANAANIYDHASVFNYKTESWHQLYAACMDYAVALDVMFIFGDLYFVADDGIYKYCPGYETEWDQ